MAGNKALNNDDSMDINELAALNGDISPELIDQLQQKLSQETQNFSSQFDENDDTTLFEEPLQTPESVISAESPVTSEQTDETLKSESEIPQQDEQFTVEEEKPLPKLDKSVDDNFIKKYKAKLNKQKFGFSGDDISSDENKQEEEISEISNGTITEKEMTQAQQEYNDSLDLLDGNVKYSKYVIYVDPQNVDFIDSLTVKERKNLINKILREQDDISITRKKFQTIQTVIKHVIVAILTIVISIPVIYWAINASLEASINNHRRAESNWGTLYRDNGKINVKQP